MRNVINVQEWQLKNLVQEEKVKVEASELAFRDARYIQDEKKRLDCYLSQIEVSRFHEADLRDLQYLLTKINHNKMGYDELVNFVNTWGC